MHSDVIWLAKPKTNTNVETETETINNLYLSNPVPNPARNYVKTRLYWNIFRDFSNIRVNACDILGNIVADNNAFSIEQINSYSCEITWEINNRTTGVYFINVNINGKKISTPVIIE
jgi:hypothetical protein